MASRKPRRRATGQDIRLRGGSIQGPPLEAVPRGSVVPGVTVRLGGTIRGPGLMPYPARLVFRAAEPVVGGDYPNEPEGLTAYAEHNGSAWGSGGVVQGSWYYNSSGGYGTSVTDATAPQSPTGVIRITYPTGFGDSSSPADWGLASTTATTQYSETYQSFWIRIAEGTGFENQTVGTKITFTGSGRDPTTTARNDVYLLLGNGGTASQHVMTEFNLVMYQQNIVSREMLQNSSGNTSYSPVITAGTWHQIEVYQALNDIDTANGVMKVWVDGTLVISYSNVTYRNVTYPYGLSGWKQTNIYGGNSGDVRTQTDYWYIDHVYLSGVPL